MTKEREEELRRLASQFERRDFVHDGRSLGGIRFSWQESLIEALDAVREARTENAELLAELRSCPGEGLVSVPEPVGQACRRYVAAGCEMHDGTGPADCYTCGLPKLAHRST